jgi:hypothetical protein
MQNKAKACKSTLTGFFLVRNEAEKSRKTHIFGGYSGGLEKVKIQSNREGLKDTEMRCLS